MVRTVTTIVCAYSLPTGTMLLNLDVKAKKRENFKDQYPCMWIKMDLFTFVITIITEFKCFNFFFIQHFY